MATSNKKGDVLQQLREGITKLTSSDAWFRYLDVQRRFHTYSWGNCLLITIQRPDATRIAGYRKWQTLGRQVRKGERAISILAPMVYRPDTDREESRTADESSDLKVVRAFRTASVFDIAQTDGEALPEITTRLLGDEPIHALLRMRTLAGELGYKVESADLPGARNGECDFEHYTIRVRNDLEPAHVVKTLAHEIAHVVLHHPNQMPANGMSRDTVELEAESVAYIVCHELGVDSSQYSVGYIAHWAGDGERAVKNIEISAARINHAAKTVLQGLEHPLLLPDSVKVEATTTIPMEPLCEEMTAGMSVGKGGMDWPDPLHHVNGHAVPSLLLTVPQACAALQVSRAQLYVMANKQRVIEMVHIGKLCRIPRASIESYVDQLRQAAVRTEGFELDGEGQ
jgi:predicted DNA-binding transcriptional regulator AlpA